MNKIWSEFEQYWNNCFWHKAALSYLMHVSNIKTNFLSKSRIILSKIYDPLSGVWKLLSKHSYMLGVDLHFATLALCNSCNLQHLQFTTLAICNPCNLQHLQYATLAICNTCNLQHLQFATHAICNTCNLQHVQFATHAI